MKSVEERLDREAGSDFAAIVSADAIGDRE